MEEKEFLISMKNFFENINSLRKDLKKEIQKEDDITQDLLHELELASLNGVEIMQVAKQLKEARQERRKYKDELEKVNILKTFTDKYNNKLIVGDIIKVLKELKILEKNKNNRKYNARVLENLKCTKKE